MRRLVRFRETAAPHFPVREEARSARYTASTGELLTLVGEAADASEHDLAAVHLPVSPR